MMSERKRRVRTGCLSCRQRRVKCDEKKPVCERCQFANIVCSGYESPKRLPGNTVSRHARKSESSSLIDASLSSENASDEPTVLAGGKLHFGQPHQRALDVLAHHQYMTTTASLLFRNDHLEFWRDYVLHAAYETEYVFNAVVALGAMHRAVLSQCTGDKQQKDAVTKVFAFQAYGNALAQVAGLYREEKSIRPDLLIAVLLILAHFECFAGNPAGAFRHLYSARHSLIFAEAAMKRNREPLVASANELALIAQIVLPVEHFPLFANDIAVAVADNSKLVPRSGTELHNLLGFISTFPTINRAIWTPLSRTEDNLDYNTLIEFRDELIRWQSMATTACQNKVDFLLLDEGMLDALPFPPQAKSIASVDAAITIALLNCYMGRISWLIAKFNGGERSYKLVAYSYAYDNLRMLGSMDREDDRTTLGAHEYVPCNAMRMGFIPILYLVATFSYDCAWQQWTAGKLASLRQEGLYNARSFAKALELISVFNARDRTVFGSKNPQIGRQNEPDVVPIMIPDTESTFYTVYYARALREKVNSKSTPTMVVGRARWKDCSSASEALNLEFYDDKHILNEGILEECVYGRISSIEPVVSSWQSLFSAQTYLS